MNATDTIRIDRQALINELIVHGAEVRGSVVRCPFHDDKNPSAGVYQSETDGVWRFKCHGCGFLGDIYDVRARALGVNVSDILKQTHEANRPKQHVFPDFESVLKTIPGQIDTTYYYTNPKTNRIDLCVIRYIGQDGKKSFSQVVPYGSGFVKQAPAKPWPLYNRAKLQDAEIVIVVEGEKCVHALLDYDIVATTSPCGAGKAEHTDWSMLAGKRVILWPDNDANGIAHMKQVAKILEKISPAPQVSWLDPSSLLLEEKEDVADFVKQTASSDRSRECIRGIILAALDLARSLGPSSEVASQIEETIAGKRKTISFPWRRIGELTNALLPGTVTLICGDPGSAKSFFLIEALTHWYKNNEKVAVYELEEDRTYHLMRSLAQISGESQILDCEWVKSNPDKAREFIESQRSTIDGLGQCIWESPDKDITLDELAEWVEKMAKAGCRVIAIDPVTAATSNDKPWIADQRFVNRVKRIVKEFKTSLILITHPKKGAKGAVGLDDLAGGTAYQRFSQTILWIKQHEGGKKVNVKGDCGTHEITINRSVILAKTRNGKGQGFEIGYMFNGHTLKFSEQGIIVEEKD